MIVTTKAENMRLTIVCVDDEDIMLRSLREQLQRGLGGQIEIEVASGGREALLLVEELEGEGRQVPLLISDQIMPGMRGDELLACMHARYPQMLKILLTGQADIDSIQHAINEAGLYRFITKPWREQDLLLTVREALHHVAQARMLAERSTALAHTNLELQMSLALLEATLDATADGILVLDRDGLPSRTNRQFDTLWRVPSELDPASILDHLSAQLVEPETLRVEWLLEHGLPECLALKDGRAVEYVSRAHQIDGQAVGVVYSFRDVTERESNAARIRHDASHDSLSGLPNRYLFDRALATAIAAARASNGMLAVLFVDLDHFKRINDTMGHDAGDDLLRTVAQRLRQCVRQGDIVARWGGDEFTALLPSVRSQEEAVIVVRRFLDALAAPVEVAGLSLRISASIGLAMFPGDGEDGQSLLKHADMALYQVKADGRNGFQRYAPAQLDGGVLTLESELGKALGRGEILLHYQPQVDTRTGKVVCVEALARWHSVRFGNVPPDVFIPIAEQTGLIRNIGEWVLEQACRQAWVWHEMGHEDLRVAVNLSAMQFSHGDPEALVGGVTTRAGVPPAKLEVEITEAIALHDVAKTAVTLKNLQKTGVSIALDDFGTGYASLRYLRTLPCNVLKIDRSFISGLKPGTPDAAIVEALVSMGTALGLRVIAEGVETAEVQELLHQCGCWIMQGYLFSRPLPASDIGALLQRGPLIPA